MTPVELSRTVLHAVRRAVDAGELSVAVPARAVVERPRGGGCGDYATGVALQLARTAGRPPRQVAEILRRRLLVAPGVAGIDITGPGFLNFTLDAVALDDAGRSGPAPALVRGILDSGREYGHAGRYGFVGAAGLDPDVDPDPDPGALPVRLRPARDLRARVVADALAAVLRSQGVPVRIVPAERERSNEGGTPAAPETPVAPDASAAPAIADIPLRPVPVPVSSDPFALGRDAARWALLHPAARDRARISRDHLAQREGNPLFRVRYAHARSRALLRNAADLGFAPELAVSPQPSPTPTAPAHTAAPAPGTTPAPASTPTTTPAIAPSTTPALLTALADYPAVLAAAADRRAPDRLARHLVIVADAFAAWTCDRDIRVLPLGDEKPSAAHRARLALAEAAGTVLAGGLSLLGIDAPDHL